MSDPGGIHASCGWQRNRDLPSARAIMLFRPRIGKFRQRKTKDANSLTLFESLQENLAAVSEPDCIPVPERRRSDLCKRHLFGAANTDLALQVFRDIPDSETGSGRNAHCNHTLGFRRVADTT
jgi:hypothetical protein